MNAVQLGPLVLSTPRLTAILGFAAFLIAAHVMSRKHPRLPDLAWSATGLVVIVARLGYVVENIGVYLREPLTVLFLWQGGFSPLWGLALASVYLLRQAEARRFVLPAALIGLATWGGTALLLTPADTATITMPGTTIHALDGEPATLKGHAAGRPLVVNLWAPWCPPCQREMPMVVQTANEFPDVAFALVDQGSPEAEVRDFLSSKGLAGDHVFLDRSARLGTELRSIGLPTTLFFDAEGALAYAHAGEISRAELLKRVREQQ